MQDRLFDNAPEPLKVPRKGKQAADPAAKVRKPARDYSGLELAEVAVDSPLRQSFTYVVPDALRGRLAVGARLRVPFGRRLLEGFYVGPGTPPTDAAVELKHIESLLDEPQTEAGSSQPLLTPELAALARWAARRWACSLGTTLSSFLPAGVKEGRLARRIRFVRPLKSHSETRRAVEDAARRAPRQAALLRGLLEFCWSAGEEHPPVAVAASDLPESVRNFGALKILAAQGLVVVEDRPAPPTDGLLCAAAQICATPGAPQLTDEQAAAWAQLEPALPTSKTAQPSAGEKAFLLHGITGSGKTELYLLALEKTLEAGRTGIVLVPEISLTPQTARRFYARLSRFGIAVLHSRQTDGERAAAWRRVRNHEVRVVVGPRSALFAPLERLGLIVIDEEHETAFKQESAPRYQTRDAARRRAADCGATLILGSATPSLEAYHGSKIGELRRLTLTRRVAGRPLPNTLIVDMNAEMRELKYATSFSRALRVAIGETLAKGEQTLLFLNRRGFAPVVICAKCRHVERCEFCDVAATFHRARQILRCHYCAAERPLPKICPACGAAHLKQLGAGTERVEDELKRLFPSARIARMDADSTVRRSTWAEILDAFQAGDIDVLIGTQMIAKGLDFPNVTLAAVVSADTALHLPDFRARERTFQLLTQVAGRTGRGPKGGRAFIQTHRPTDQAVLTAARHDFDTFATGELQERKMFGYPPFSRLARVLFRATDAARAATAAQEARQMLEPDARALGLRILGPSPAPLSRIENWNRFHLLLKTPVIETPKHHAEYALGDKNPLSELFCSTAAKKMERISGVEVAIDIDPQSLL